MSLKGNLKTFDLPNVLQLLCNGEKTGIFKVSNSEKEVKIIFQTGAVVYATSSQKEFRLGCMMVADGIISDKILESCINENKQSENAIGKILVESGYVSKDVLISYARKQALEILYNLFFWAEGDFEYNETIHNLEKIIVSPIQIMPVLLEASRRMDEMAVITRKISDMNTVFQISDAIAANKNIILNLYEWRILSFIDGKQSINQIIKKSGADKLSVLKILYSLTSGGIIREKITDSHDNSWLNYSDLIKAYYEVLQIAYSNLEP